MSRRSSTQLYNSVRCDMTSALGVARAFVWSVVVTAAIASTRFASAVDFSFENPPYTAGASLIGQDGWVTGAYVLADPFFGGAVNGTVDSRQVIG